MFFIGSFFKSPFTEMVAFYYTGNGWSMTPQDAQYYKNRIQAESVIRSRKLTNSIVGAVAVQEGASEGSEYDLSEYKNELDIRNLIDYFGDRLQLLSISEIFYLSREMLGTVSFDEDDNDSSLFGSLKKLNRKDVWSIVEGALNSYVGDKVSIKKRRLFTKYLLPGAGYDLPQDYYAGLAYAGLDLLFFEDDLDERNVQLIDEVTDAIAAESNKDYTFEELVEISRAILKIALSCAEQATDLEIKDFFSDSE